MFPIAAGQASTSVELPTSEDVESFIMDLLPSPAYVLTESFYQAPLFAVACFYEAAQLYECFPDTQAVMESLGFSAEDYANKSLRTNVWFAELLGCDKDTNLAAVEMYRSFRGSPDMLRHLNPASRVASTNREGPPLPPGRDNDRSLREGLSDVAQDPASHTNVRARDHPPRDTDHGRNRVPETFNPSAPDIAAQDTYDSRKATNVFQYFKDNKFTGDISQSIKLAIRDYNVCARQHNLTAKQKADLFINALADPARTFFFKNANDNMTFEDMARMMVPEYNSDALQLQVQGRLDTLRLDKFMTEHQITSHSEGLTKIVDLIERLTPQCQLQFRSDANKLSYLRKAVLGFNWAMVPLGNIITAKYSFNAFVTALREHLQLENEFSLSNPSALRPFKDSMNCTFHQRYGRPPKQVRKYGPPGNHPGKDIRQTSNPSFEDSRRKGICHRCRQKWRPGHRCQPGSIHGYVRNRLKNGDSAIHIVSDLVLGLEGDVDKVRNDADDSGSEQDEEAEKDIRYGEAQEDLSLFDELIGGAKAEPTGFVEMEDKEWFTNHLSASFSAEGDSHSHYPPQDF